MIVTDAPLMVAWVLEEANAAPTLDLDELFGHQALIVPPHWWTEIGNAFTINVRRGRIPRDRMEVLLERLSALAIEIEPPRGIRDLAAFVRFADAYSLTLYDAAYVQIALERTIPLGTLDHAMRQAATRLGIPLLPAVPP